MYVSETQIRIHYALTDQMGVVYHGHFAQLYEIGRTESIRQLGFAYKEIEALGIIMPVVDLHVKFFQPAKYDDLVTVKTTLKAIPLNHKVIFYGEIFNENNDLLSTGEITMYFMNAKEMTRANMPEPLIEKLKVFFK
jgi:acyl-CoA thioester hydrolase